MSVFRGRHAGIEGAIVYAQEGGLKHQAARPGSRVVGVIAGHCLH